MDNRERSCYPANIVQDCKNMKLVLGWDGEDTLPAKYEVCPDCQGRGQYVNPSIDSHGLSSEDFDQDPDFAESYFGGDYDITCQSCCGNRVILVPATEDGRAVIQEILDHEAQCQAEIAAERRMGA